MLTLTIASSAHGDRSQQLTEEDLLGAGATIGRAMKCQVVLDDPGVSRSHARLSLNHGSVFITDLGSTGGTALNGSRVAPDRAMRLAKGDRIGIGPFVLTVGSARTGAHAMRTTIMSDPPVATYMPLAGLAPEAFARWEGGPLNVRLLRVIDEAPGVRTLVLTGEQPTLFIYQPGQSLQIHAPLPPGTLTRSYSISSSPSRPHTLAITVRQKVSTDGAPTGIVSTWLHQRVPGDILKISGPYGDFSCVRHPAPRLLLLGAGIGATPLLAMARWLCDVVAEVDVVLLLSTRTSAHIVARDELESCAKRNPRLRLVLVTTRPEPAATWPGLVGRITGETLRTTVPDFMRRTVFCCGPEGFMVSMRALLLAGGMPVKVYHEERFSGGHLGSSSGSRTAANVRLEP